MMQFYQSTGLLLDFPRFSFKVREKGRLESHCPALDLGSVQCVTNQLGHWCMPLSFFDTGARIVPV